MNLEDRSVYLDPGENAHDLVIEAVVQQGVCLVQNNMSQLGGTVQVCGKMNLTTCTTACLLQYGTCNLQLVHYLLSHIVVQS